MRWYKWKFWRLAYSNTNINAYYCTDFDGGWIRITERLWYLKYPSKRSWIQRISDQPPTE